MCMCITIEISVSGVNLANKSVLAQSQKTENSEYGFGLPYCTCVQQLLLLFVVYLTHIDTALFNTQPFWAFTSLKVVTMYISRKYIINVVYDVAFIQSLQTHCSDLYNKQGKVTDLVHGRVYKHFVLIPVH